MLQLTLGLENIRNYRRLAYTPWHALAEFVDNSTQSYFDNQDVLDECYRKEQTGLEVNIVLDRATKRLRITDNAMGMGLEELSRAVNLGTPPPNPDGRSTYGLGMKTAGCWFGNVMHVRTKKLDEAVEHTIEFDIERIAEGDADLRYQAIDVADQADHYTIVELSELHKVPPARTIGKMKDFLRSMYRMDIASGILTLCWQNAALEWPEIVLLRDREGSEYRRTFQFDVNGKPVSGWVGILQDGSRAKAGFSILRANRVVRGWPESWRPESLYGQIEGSNDLINQRLVGEIHLNDFEVAHTKDSILWEDDDEAIVLRLLAEYCGEYREYARDYRRGQAVRSHDNALVSTAAAQLREELESAEMVDQLSVVEIPTPEAVSAALAEPLQAITADDPAIIAKLSMGDTDLEIPVYLSYSLSINDPYVGFDAAAPNRIVIVINMRHPHLQFVRGSDGLTNYFRQCVYDVLAQWRASRYQRRFSPETLRILKDGLLRIPMEIETRLVDHEI